MKNNFYILFIVLLLLNFGCNSSTQNNIDDTDKEFVRFEETFLDAYWKNYPSGSIYSGYGKYYDKLIVPDSSTFASNISFSKNWIDSLNKFNYNQLSENYKISFKIIKNQLESDIWYTTVFKIQEPQASMIAGSFCGRPPRIGKGVSGRKTVSR